MSDHAHQFAKIRSAIEAGETDRAMNAAQALVHQLGGTVDLSRLSPGFAALYLVSLTMSPPTAATF